MNISADSMHRLVKLAMDSGEAANPEEAESIFSSYRLHIHLGDGWNATSSGQAAFLTALNTASRAFLGGVLVTGNTDQVLTVPLYRGKNSATIVAELGGRLSAEAPINIPTLVIGKWEPQATPPFCIQLGFQGWRAGCWPIHMPATLSEATDNPLAGVAAAALGVNEAFLHVRGDLLAAGDRIVGISLWNPSAVDEWASDANDGPELIYLPASLSLIGLGHLGQAYAWILGMLPYVEQYPHLLLQDVDSVSQSNLSTCMLVWARHLGKRKTRVVAECLEAIGFKTTIVERLFTEHSRVEVGEPSTALFGVDNVAARRAIDSGGFGLVVEAGLGSGYRDFRNIRTHVFPGSRTSKDIWPASDTSQLTVKLSPVYERIAEASNDPCGVTQLATRAVATPFVGALAASFVVSDVIRLLHGGPIYATMDMQMKDLRHRTIARAPLCMPVMPSFFQA